MRMVNNIRIRGVSESIEIPAGAYYKDYEHQLMDRNGNEAIE